MYVNHRQNNWSEWLATAEFAFNNKVHTAIKMLPFQANYCQVSQMVDLVFLYFYFNFLFYFNFNFLFLEQLGLGLEVISHTVTSVTI